MQRRAEKRGVIIILAAVIISTPHSAHLQVGQLGDVGGDGLARADDGVDLGDGARHALGVDRQVVHRPPQGGGGRLVAGDLLCVAWLCVVFLSV